MKKICVIIGCLMVFSCSKENAQGDIVPRDKFVSLLIRMHLLDARISFNQVVDPHSINTYYGEYENLLEQYGTDSAAVSRTFDHYRDRQEELISIYQEVQDSLVQRAEATIKPK